MGVQKWSRQKLERSPPTHAEWFINNPLNTTTDTRINHLYFIVFAFFYCSPYFWNQTKFVRVKRETTHKTLLEKDLNRRSINHTRQRWCNVNTGGFAVDLLPGYHGRSCDVVEQTHEGWQSSRHKYHVHKSAPQRFSGCTHDSKLSLSGVVGRVEDLLHQWHRLRIDLQIDLGLFGNVTELFGNINSVSQVADLVDDLCFFGLITRPNTTTRHLFNFFAWQVPGRSDFGSEIIVDIIQCLIPEFPKSRGLDEYPWYFPQQWPYFCSSSYFDKVVVNDALSPIW